MNKNTFFQLPAVSLLSHSQSVHVDNGRRITAQQHYSIDALINTARLGAHVCHVLGTPARLELRL